jgi:internalin A
MFLPRLKIYLNLLSRSRMVLLDRLDMRKLTKNMKKVLTMLLVSALLLQILSVSIVSARESSIKTFVQWCKQKNALPKDTQYTIDVLLRRAGTKDCQEAERNLNKLNRLQIGADEISDLRPIASLKNLTNLDLAGNEKISDIRPIASLNNLTDLNLTSNRISDIRPLTSLNKLTSLRLASNQISDIRPLANLNYLTKLNINTNKISDLRPLASLNKLTGLYLDSKFTKKDCPVKLEVCVEVRGLTDEEL